jgi:hypothetical protein
MRANCKSLSKNQNTNAINCNYCPSPMHNKASDENEMQKFQKTSKNKYERANHKCEKEPKVWAGT